MKASDMLHARDGRLLVEDAFLTIAVCAAKLDDTHGFDYTTRIVTLAKAHPVFANITKGIEKRVYLIANALTVVDWEESIDLAVKSLPAKLKESALTWAAKIVRHHEVGIEKKRDFLDNLATRLSIDSNIAAKIINVKASRNRTLGGLKYEAGHETGVVDR
jgi:hypothetical protein